MGAEVAVLTGLAAAGNEIHNSRTDRKRQKQINQQQLQDKKRTLESRRKQQAAHLRARYAASGLSPKSRSLVNLLDNLNQENDTELQSLNNLHSLRTPSAKQQRSNHFTSLLRGLQPRGGS